MHFRPKNKRQVMRRIIFIILPHVTQKNIDLCAYVFLLYFEELVVLVMPAMACGYPYIRSPRLRQEQRNRSAAGVTRATHHVLKYKHMPPAISAMMINMAG